MPLELNWQNLATTNISTTNILDLKDKILSKRVNKSIFERSWSERLKVTDGNRRLLIDSVFSEDSGIYTCNAENIAGADSMNFTVSVMGK